MLPGLELGIDQIVVDANLEAPLSTGDQGNLFDHGSATDRDPKLVDHRLGQTGRARRVVSRNAEFDANDCHRFYLSRSGKPIAFRKARATSSFWAVVQMMMSMPRIRSNVS